jgi:hypothetical protein
MTHRHKLSLKSDCCDNFSTTPSITLNKVSLESLWQCRQPPMKILPNLHIFSGSFAYEKYDPFTHCLYYFAFLTAAFALICDSQQDKVLGGYLSPLLKFGGSKVA